MSRSILADQATYERITAMSRVFAKTDRVLSGNPINIVVDNSQTPAPSWTDGKTIWFNQNQIGSVTSIDDLIRLSGLNYHELAHCLYTPRTNTVVVQAVRLEAMHNAFNLLEDQRIETLLTTVYPSTIPYLVSTFMRFCIRNEHAWAVNYPLVYGRRYIPADVRAEFRRRFRYPHLAKRFEEIIDEYRKIVYPADNERGIELLREFNALLRQMGSQPEDPNGHSTGQRPDVSGGRPSTQKEQRDASSSIDDMDDELADRDKNSPQDDSSDSDDDDAGSGPESDDDADDNGGGNADSDDDSDSSGSGNGGSDDAVNETPGSNSGDGDGAGGSGPKDDSESPTDNSSGFDPGVPGDLDKDQVRKMFEDIAKQFENLPDVREDTAAKQHAIVNNDGDLDASFGNTRSREFNIDPQSVSIAKRFSAVLQRLRADSDPGWKQRQSSGRINVRRAMDGAHIDELWDRWEEGNNDACDIECVILLDSSGSMTYRMDSALRAMWTIKRAMESLDANVTVLTYGNREDTRVLYRKTERVNRTKFRATKANGSTFALKATVEAVKILESSKRTNKIFITITDGAWNYEHHISGDTPDSLIEKLGDRGVTTALAFISGWDNYPMDAVDGHKCQIKQNVSNPIELVDFAKLIVSQSVRNTARK